MKPKDLHYKDVRVSPSSTLWEVLTSAKDPKLNKAAREELEQRAALIYQECEAEYQSWRKKHA